MDLTHGVTGEFRHHVTALGNFEPRDLCFELGQQIGGLQFNAGFGNHHGHADLAEIRIGHAYDGGLGHAWQGIHKALDFSRIHVVAAADVQVFAAPDDADKTQGINKAHIPCLEIAVSGEFFGGLFRHAPVA